jgi:hypothetical protein
VSRFQQSGPTQTAPGLGSPRANGDGAAVAGAGFGGEQAGVCFLEGAVLHVNFETFYGWYQVPGPAAPPS